jgi:hypothetical protein
MGTNLRRFNFLSPFGATMGSAYFRLGGPSASSRFFKISQLLESAFIVVAMGEYCFPRLRDFEVSYGLVELKICVGARRARMRDASVHIPARVLPFGGPGGIAYHSNYGNGDRKVGC